MIGAFRLTGITLLTLLVWQALVTGFALPRFILPGPGLVLETLWTSRALLAEHALVTTVEVLFGLILGGILGFASAILLAASPLARSVLRPILVFSQAVPVFALAPMAPCHVVGHSAVSHLAPSRVPVPSSVSALHSCRFVLAPHHTVFLPPFTKPSLILFLALTPLFFPVSRWEGFGQ